MPTAGTGRKNRHEPLTGSNGSEEKEKEVIKEVLTLRDREIYDIRN